MGVIAESISTGERVGLKRLISDGTPCKAGPLMPLSVLETGTVSNSR